MRKLLLALFAICFALPGLAALPEAAWPSSALPENALPGGTFPGSLENYMAEEVRKAKPADYSAESKLTAQVSVSHLVKTDDAATHAAYMNAGYLCGAIFIDNRGTLLIDKPCSKVIEEAFSAKKDKDELLENGRSLGILVELDKLGKYSNGSYKGESFFYAGSPAQNHFKKTKEGYVLFTIPFSSTSEAKQALERAGVPSKPPVAKDLSNIFKNLGYTRQQNLPAGIVEK